MYDINGSLVKTLMVPPNNLGPNLSGKAVNKTQYRGMIRSLMYLTASRPDQANPKYSHLIAIKRIFRKSTFGACQLLVGKLVCRKTGVLDQISNKDATMLCCLANGVQVDYAKIIWEDQIHKLNKKTRENIVLYPRFVSLLLEHMALDYDKEELTINLTQVLSVHNWILKPNQPKEPPFTDHIKAICNLDVLVDFKAPKSSSQTKEVPQGKNFGAKSGLRRKQSSKHISRSTIEASISQSGQSTKETKSSSAKDKSPSHHSPPTAMVGEMHKEAQQVAGGPTSLRATRSNPFIDKTKSARDGLKTTHTDSGANEDSRVDDISLKVKLEDLADILKDTRSSFFTLDSPPDEPIISQKEELEKAKAKAKAKVTSIKVKPLYPDINQLTELLLTPLKSELSKLLAFHDLACCLLTELKELPSKITGLSGEIKELQQHIRDMEIEMPGDLIEILTKLESSFLAQEKLKTLDFHPSLLYKVTDTLNRFANMVENASGVARMNVRSVGQATASFTEGEKNTKDANTNLKDELIDLLGKNVVTRYYTKKLLFDKYYDKILKRKKSPKITNYKVLTKKGHITSKNIQGSESDEVITNLKVSDLLLAEWREVIQACPDKSKKELKNHL
nr:hypothetical protein [Tanacetum cinerariifolium]